MLDFPELFAPARMVSGLMSIDCRCAIDLYPQTLIRVKPSEFREPLGFLDPAWWFILDHPYQNTYQETSRKMQVYNAASPRNRKNSAGSNGADSSPHKSGVTPTSPFMYAAPSPDTPL